MKNNFNTADEYQGSTDMGFLKEVVKQVLAINPKKVIIGESSTIM